ncbi:hypothetical protein PILCRDRAFT_821115 [Piloderma croceum F 1598]|uniref:Bromo domain-containing protein n=1 Tax=Piloderma croceum (strain F 1598) TaxID=765440 RepID=A0A0C3FPX8_PILCF|nr:hypothetical protein PILCRDRAFT_821115 [Piloderma croceum F 1598]
MTVTTAQRAAIEQVINVIISTTPSRGKRQLSAMFVDLVDRKEYPEYYELVPEPRCLSDIRASVEKSRYKDAMSAYTDLSLVFWNAIFYNESESQIAQDAVTLKDVLDSEWRKHSVLPSDLRASPPPSSAQKVHAKLTAPAPATPEPTPAARTSTPRISTPKPAAPNTLRASVPAAASVPATSKTVPILPRTPQSSVLQLRPLSVEMDVDVEADVDVVEGDSVMGTSAGVGGGEILAGGEAEGAGVGMGMERDSESDEIVRVLEKGLPKWKGFENVGWMGNVGHERHIDIIHAIKSYKDVVGNRFAAALEAVPEESTIPYLSYTTALSLKSIETKNRTKQYESSKDFDMDMTQLFEKARRWHEPSSESYGRILLLQRLYQALTSTNPPPGPPYSSTTNFASLRAGPGTARPVHATHTADPEGGVPGVTTFRVSNKDRTFVDEVQYKGWTIKLADWLHLSNPDDPGRPIVAQVFKCWVSDESAKKGQPGLTMCWYYRPEQTFHPAQRQFWEGEVFKTSHFADHPLEDIIEKIACQFTARHIRGRPRPPFWYPGWPLYVCDSRYNDRERVFVRIKNWNSCVPEEVRKSDEFMPIYPFERTVFPRRFASPFIGKGAIKGPGGIGHSVERVEGETVDAGTGRKRPRRTAGGDGPSKGLYVGLGTQGSITTAGGNPSSAQPFQYQASHLSLPLQPHRVPPVVEDRSIVSAAGGIALLGGHAHIEKLPSETAKYFDRDPETNEVLWFSAPPLNVAHPPAPKYSLAYLHFLATKRKKEKEDADNMDVDHEAAKKQRLRTPPTVTESLSTLFADMSRST